MNSDPAKCPICGRDNECQLSCADGDKGPCWCAQETFPPELLARIPDNARNRVCVCRQCVLDEEEKSGSKASLRANPGAE